jgi:23S rRNA pseudouridine2605 synthase
VYDHVPPHFPDLPHVGRLDWESEGLLLFMDDGRLAQALLNPGFAGRADKEENPPIEKVYHLKLRDRMAPDDRRFRDMERPLRFRSGPVTLPARVRFLEHRTRATWVEVILQDGRNRQIRRLAERAGLQVLKLRRVAIGPVCLGDFRVRWCRALREDEVAALYAAALPGEERPTWEPIDESAEAYARARAERTAAGAQDGAGGRGG